MPPDTGGHTVSALHTAEAAFLALTAGPDGLHVDGGLGFLPDRRIGLRELRVLLTMPQTRASTRQAAWSHLLTQLQVDRNAWTVAAAGMAMPLLRHTAARLGPVYGGDPADLDGEILTGFLTVLGRLTPATPRIVRRLGYGAFRAGLAAAHTHSAAGPDGAGAGAGTAAGVVSVAVPPQPWADVHQLLARAVHTGVIDRFDAEVIRLSRLERVPLAVLSRPDLLPGEELALRRTRAEVRLVRAILAGHLGPDTGAGR